MRIEMRERIRGGEGTLKCLNLLEKNDCYGKFNYVAIMELKQGKSIGMHPHGPDAEIYYLLKGQLTAIADGVKSQFYEGDIMLTANGKSHSVINESPQLAQLLAIVVP